MRTLRLTAAQALVRFLVSQYVERDGQERRFFAGTFAIFGHGNVAGLGEALRAHRAEMLTIQGKNEQAMVHAAAGFARMCDRLATFACTTSIGPGATNLVTGAAAATINRLPVLLIPGDVFASRRSDPVLQQLETSASGDVSVNDALRPVSRYFDRIARPEQVVPAALAAMRVLTSAADTGAVTLAFPQDVQTQAFDVPASFVEKRVWHVERRPPDPGALARAIELIRAAKRPLIVAGGGVIYSGATEALRRFVDATGIAECETQAGKGALPYDHPLALGAIGATGTRAANALAREADVVIGIGTRWTDFTTASRSVFQRPDVRFVNVNVADADAFKLGAVPVLADARAALEALCGIGPVTDEAYRADARRLHDEWDAEVARLYALGNVPLPARSEIIGAVNEAAGERGIVVCAAGALPGELHKLWRARDPKQYHVEYGYSTMGYEIAGALGVKLAAPDREVFVLVGDGSYLMLSSEIATAVQEGHKLVIVVVDDHGHASIGGLSRSLGLDGAFTRYGVRRGGSIGSDAGDGVIEPLPIDLAANARSLGAEAVRVRTIPELRSALAAAARSERTTAIVIEADRYAAVPRYDAWWDVAVPETSEQEAVRAAREAYESAKRGQRWHL